LAEPEPRPPVDAVAAGALAVASAAVLLSLFLRWYRVEASSVPLALSADPDASGWDLLSALDVVLAAACAGGILLGLALASGARLAAVPLGAAAAGFACALGLVVWRAFDPAVHVVAGHADVVPALGPYLAIGGLASMVLAAGLCAIWRT
jgi:hypothetical protein